MSDMLSEDQINDLLSQGGLEGEESVPADDSTPEDSGQSKDYEALTSALDVFREQASSVISTLTNKDVEMELEQGTKCESETLAQLFAEAPVCIAVPFESGITGTLYVLLDKKTVAGLSDLMMMGDGSAEYSDEHKDAIGEIFNQIVGSFNTAFGTAIEGSVSSGALEVTEFDTGNPPLDLGAADMATIHVKIEEIVDAQIAAVLTDELSGQLMAKMAKNQQGGEEIGGDIGMNMNELQDLSNVTSDLAGGSEGGFVGAGAQAPAASGNVNLLLDVELDVSIELGGANLSIKRVLELAPGSIVELDKMAGEPVDLLVNNKVVAKGEVVVVDENFGIRIVSLVSPEERIKSLG